MKSKYINILFAVLVVSFLLAIPVLAGVTNFQSVHLDSSEPTAVPLLMIRNRGNSNAFEVRNSSGTPEVQLNATRLDLNDTYLDQSIGTQNVGIQSVVTRAITYTAAAGGSGIVATVPDGQIWIVHKVLTKVTTNFDATGDDANLVVGDGNDADGFLVLADATLQAADTEGTGFAVGWQGQAAATIGAYLEANENGFVYAPSGAAETIDWAVTETSGTTLAAGAATIYVIYTRIQ